ncbi:MAG: hypothetical protein MUF62_14060, partial [Chitinophagaceae bacterium]|nr:hypothetical protein [Chitinophagaceae bacterium]
MALNHDVKGAAPNQLTGDPTETALVAHVLQQYSEAGSWPQQYERVAELPFDSDRKC